MTALINNKNAAAGDSSTEHVTGEWQSVPELQLRDHRFTVPLDYSRGTHSSPKITVFAREVVAVGKVEQTLPYLLYLQGGPGFECMRPTESSGWIQKACEEFRVILMDQRGTGLSTPLSVSSMSQFKSAQELADFLKHFRADNIVNDAEFIRVRIVPNAGPWTILGQSYGGFCAVTYLSFAPQGLKIYTNSGGRVVMAYPATDQQYSTFSTPPIKQDEPNADSADDEPESSRQDKKPVKHRRNYQACEPCRERKVKCDLGDVDNPSKGPCAKCARESKTCWFRETRKKDASKNAERAPKRPRTDSSQSDRTVPTMPAVGTHSPLSATNGFAYSSHPLSPTGTRPFPPVSSPGSINSTSVQINGYPSQPRSTPTQQSRGNNIFTSPQNVMANSFPGGPSSASRTTTSNEDDHVVMPQAKSLSQAFTNTTDNMSVLVRAATTSEAGGDPLAHRQRQRALTGSAGEVDLSKLSPQAARTRQQARQVWSQMRFVRAGWFTADEALQYVEHFYSHLALLTPVVTQDFRDPSTHRQLLTEEPVLALAILAISSRYYELQTTSKTSRGYYIHEKLWDSLRKIVQRLLWGQEQFGGGFTGAGMVPTQETATGQITWKGSLRTLGTIEALLLLTDWQPRALHFPPGDDENKLVGAGFALLEDEKPRPADSGNHLPYATWLEPAWRSDRMSWMLLGLAQSLSFELGVFDNRHERCQGQHGVDSECMRRKRIRRLVITYVSQISGRIGIQSSLSPEQDNDPLGPQAWTSIDYMQKLWFDIAHIMFDANRDIFPSRETTSALIETGEYKAAIARLKPRLEQWMQNYRKASDHLEEPMKNVLRMEFEYANLYINSLGLQKVVGQMALQDPSTTSRGLSAQLGPVYDENKQYIDEVRHSAAQILYASCFGLGNLNALGYSPVRTFLRTLSGLMFSLKLLILGCEERDLRKTFKLLREMTKRMAEQVVDDVHLSPHAAKMVQQIIADVQGNMVRIPKPGSHGQSRNMSPQPPQAPNASTSAVSDQESPDALGQIPMADYQNQTFMMPSNFDISNFDSNMAFDNVDPNLFSSGDDWISMPIDNLFTLDASTVNQGYGGIGPTFGDRDMLSIITGSHLDQNQGNGMPSNFPNFPNVC